MPSKAIIAAWKSPHCEAREAAWAKQKPRALKLQRDGLTHAEIAESLGVGRGAVRNWLRDAKEQQP